MGQPYVGEIRMFGGNFAPAGWSFCNGALLPISENEVLFQLIGTTYGGDGQSTFGLPNLQSRVPVHVGSTILGEMGGVESVTLNTNQIPVHTHPFLATTSLGAEPTPAGNTTAQSGTLQWYRGTPPTVALVNTSLQPAGGSQPHDNMIPYLAISFIISLFGIYPSPS
jgi:microcystin-dependent protein